MSRRLADAWLRLVLWVVALMLLAPATGRADGGIPMALKVIGPYEVTVFASPFPHQAGLTIDISTLLEHYPSGDLVSDAQVVVTAAPASGQGRSFTFPATHAQATNPAFYAANVRLPAGRWQIVVDLRDGTWTGQVPFQLDVSPSPHHSRFQPRTLAAWLAALLVLTGAVVVAVRAGWHAPGNRLP